MIDKIKAHVIAHTHWDRAWYWPVERFRIKLIECVESVIRQLRKHPDYIFNFDGQTLMLEDYLEVCSSDTAYLRQCAAEGRIRLGPMYCLADLYCTGGESLIRNLLAGQRWCSDFGGGRSEVLYMPDTFGITPCIPMIAAGFGFRGFCFMRGAIERACGLDETETSSSGEAPLLPRGARFFRWRSRDGSCVDVIRLRDGYASAAVRIGRGPDAGGDVTEQSYAEALVEKAASWDSPPAGPVLLMAGVDHQIPWDGQKIAMDMASEQGGYRFVFSSLEEVMDELAADPGEELFTCENGEFHAGGGASILGGTVSARIYLKQKNAIAEQLLIHSVEPAAACSVTLGRPDTAFAALDHAWKILLRTHPHDDICGCSVDAVHRKNESDMQQALESADALRRRCVSHIAHCLGGHPAGPDRPGFTLINFQGQNRGGPARFRFDFEGLREWGDMSLPEYYRIVDAEGRPAAFREIGRGVSTEHPRQFVDLELYPCLLPARAEHFFLEPTGPWPKPLESEEPLSADNEHLGVRLNPDGSFNITCKSSGKRYPSMGYFSGQGDIGDGYDFSDIPQEREAVFDGLSFRLSSRLWPGGVQELSAAGSLMLPAETDSKSRERSGQMVELPVRVTLVLTPGSKRIEATVCFTNTASGHRLRWNLSPAVNSRRSVAGLKFSTVERPAGRRPEGAEPPRIFPIHPADHFAAAGDIAVFSRFPFNYELIGEESQRLAVTLCRSVSYLSNPFQTATRSTMGSGPSTLTPEARCLNRRFEMRFAIRPFSEEETDSLFHEAVLWRAEPFFGQPDATMSLPGRENPARAHHMEKESLFRIDPPAAVSAFKPAQDGGGVILRLFNTSAQARDIALFHRFPADPRPVRLDETSDPGASCEAAPGCIRCRIPPYGLRSFRISV